eukprot:364824-Chlamydomonas_euryale.AAC.7
MDVAERDQHAGWPTLTAPPVFAAFKFEPRRSRIDWRVLHGVEVNPIVRSMGVGQEEVEMGPDACMPAIFLLFLLARIRERLLRTAGACRRVQHHWCCASEERAPQGGLHPVWLHLPK